MQPAENPRRLHVYTIHCNRKVVLADGTVELRPRVFQRKYVPMRYHLTAEEIERMREAVTQGGNTRKLIVSEFGVGDAGDARRMNRLLALPPKVTPPA